jgi:hypothetical protein
MLTNSLSPSGDAPFKVKGVGKTWVSNDERQAGRRCALLWRICQRKLTQQAAADALGLSVRQVKRFYRIFARCTTKDNSARSWVANLRTQWCVFTLGRHKHLENQPQWILWSSPMVI